MAPKSETRRSDSRKLEKRALNKKWLDSENKRNEQVSALDKNLKESNIKLRTETAEELATIAAENEKALEKTESMANQLQAKQKKYLNIINKKNYEDKYPKPEFLKNHQLQNPDSFYLQVLGCRGSGKSTFINRIFRATGLREICIYIAVLSSDTFL